MGGKKAPILSAREQKRVTGDYYQSDDTELQTFTVDGDPVQQPHRPEPDGEEG